MESRGLSQLRGNGPSRKIVLERRHQGSNREFATTNVVFRKACEIAKVQPTKRQASNYRLKRGPAYAVRRVAVLELSKEAHNVV